MLHVLCEECCSGVWSVPVVSSVAIGWRCEFSSDEVLCRAHFRAVCLGTLNKRVPSALSFCFLPLVLALG